MSQISILFVLYFSLLPRCFI